MEPLKWKAPEYEHRDKTSDWFWVLGIIAVSGAVAAVLFGNVLFGALILIGAFVLAIFAAKKPETVEFEINERGVRIGKKLYPYSTLDHFGIVENANTPKLYLQSTKMLAPHMVILLEGVSEKDVRDRLSKKLPEEDEGEEPFSERVMDMFGF
ncbi:MAG: hypothetical protein WDZ90_00120 [Candidatus Paceibacterota bacterium]